MNSSSAPPRVLTVAGSDSCGGAGIEADLKTFAALQVYGMAAVTSVTAQNTMGVFAVHDVPPEVIAKQIDVVAEDVGVDAAKSGMLSSAAIVEAVASAFERNGIVRYVLDPVMVSETGRRLLQEEAVEVLKERLMPLATVVTPNAAETEVLTGVAISDGASMREAAEALHAAGAKAVLIKGGHLAGASAMDMLYDGNAFTEVSAPRIDTRNTHGTGCTYAAAIAAYLAQGRGLVDAVREAKTYVTGAIRHGFDLGAGAGPLNHFWPRG